MDMIADAESPTKSRENKDIDSYSQDDISLDSEDSMNESYKKLDPEQKIIYK